MERGQIFSLDFLISLVAATAAIGLLVQAVEVQAYSQKEEGLFNDLRRVAENAANLLIASNETTCLVAETNEHLVNCIDSSKFFSARKARILLGIPETYGFSLSGATISWSDGTPDSKDFYEVKRIVVVNSGGISKAEFDSGDFDSGPNPVEITLRAWRE